ncbi:lysophospholipid acyltransferase family protein [Leptolyngbya sp. FACHB-671]|uniref:lysophospholipid acyltransferase family protein n=1 Tax=Leptolyngbya sp. FACHB-671 TaxID=2692812 RepID=UPI00321F9CA1
MYSALSAVLFQDSLRTVPQQEDKPFWAAYGVHNDTSSAPDILLISMVLFNSFLESVKSSVDTAVDTATPQNAIDSRFSPWLTPLVYPLARRIVLPFYFGKIEVTGQENLPITGPVILAPTHRARWDAIMVPYATGRTVTGRDLRFMVTADEVKGIQGWFIRRLGGFPVNTKRPTVASLRHGVEVLQNGEMLVIFPEGGIFRDGQLHPLKPGLGRLAIQAEMSQPGLGVQVVPIALDYGEAFPTRGCNVKIQIGKPLKVANYVQGAAKQGAKRFTADLEAALRALAGEATEAEAEMLSAFG